MNYFCFVIYEFLILLRVLRNLENTAPAINAPPSSLKANNDVFGRVIDFLMISWQKMIGYEGDYFDKVFLFIQNCGALYLWVIFFQILFNTNNINHYMSFGSLLQV